MTAPERLAQVAEVLWVAESVYEGSTREWAEAAWADMGGSEPSAERAEREVYARALAPLLTQWQAEDRAAERERIAQAIETDTALRLGHNVSVACSCLRCEVVKSAARIAREGGAS